MERTGALSFRVLLVDFHRLPTAIGELRGEVETEQCSAQVRQWKVRSPLCASRQEYARIHVLRMHIRNAAQSRTSRSEKIVICGCRTACVVASPS